MKYIYEAFDVEPKIEVQQTMEHICGEDGCELKPVTKKVQTYPALTINHVDELFQILIKHKKDMNTSLYMDIVELLEKVKHEG